MPLRYVCPHCQGSGKQYGFRLLSFIKCKVCAGDGHVIMSMDSKYDKDNKNADTEQRAEEEVSS
jgi:DnaJ-class molecular chaperone